jgi:4-hydroxy-tetrahydrodipicolinate synthase
MDIHGIHTALITPFHENGDLDLKTYRTLCERQLDQGIHGLVACGTTGETPTLSLEEQEETLKATLEVAQGRVPVTMGVGTNNTRTTLSRIERAATLGADAGLLVFPYYNKPNPNGLRAHVKAAASIGLPLVLYHVPGRTGQHVDSGLVAELTAIEGVIAVKEATGDVGYGADLIGQTKVSVLSGDDFSFLGLLAQGGSGCISVVSNIAPARTVAAYTCFKAGKTTQATNHLKALLPLIQFLFSESNPVPCKAAMAQMGLCGPAVRLPLAPFSGEAPTELLTSLELL